MKETRLERGLLEVYFKTVGVELGFYDKGTKQLQTGLESQGVYQTNLETVRACLKGPWTAIELKSLILERYKVGERTALLSAILPKNGGSGGIKDSDNLLDRDETFEHPHLYQIAPPRYRVTSTGMELVQTASATLKEQFTLIDLYHYFMEELQCDDWVKPNQARAGLRWYLHQSSLDQLLFAIDAARDQGEVRSIFDLSRHMEQATEEIQYRTSRSY